jgi:hypothetical protein
MSNDTKNPYSHDTPGWQLFENALSLEAQAFAFQADSERYVQKSAEARAKADRYREALAKIAVAEGNA